MRKISLYMGLAMAAAVLAVAVPALAASNHSLGHLKSGAVVARPAIVGLVTVITGTTLIVSVQAFSSQVKNKPVFYTVNASTAIVTARQRGIYAREGTSTAPLALSTVAVKDRVAVFGTVTGRSVNATKIIDIHSRLGLAGGKFAHKAFQKNTGATRVIVGSVNAIDGSQFTIITRMRDHLASTTASASVNRTIITTNATMFRANGKPVSFNNLAIGNTVLISGTSTAPDTLTAGMVRILEPRK